MFNFNTLRFRADPEAAASRALEGIDLTQSVDSAVAAVDGDQGSPPGAPAPGTEDAPATPTDPPAGAQNTDTGREGPPETIPYPRFKEVNDRARPYFELEDEGYDADSLRQLAHWANTFDTDPVGSWLNLAKQLDDLPDEVKQAVEAHMSTPQTPSNRQTEGQQQNGEPPVLPEAVQAQLKEVDELKKRLDDRDQAEEAAARRETLDGMLAWWRAEDTKAGLKPLKDDYMLTLISGNSGVEGVKTVEDLQKAARDQYLELRDESLGGVVRTPGSEPPVAVPGGGATPVETPEPPKTLTEASRLAQEAIQAGTLNTEGLRSR